MSETLAETFNRPHVVPASGARILTNAYRWYREHGKPATAALAAARRDASEDKQRWPAGGPRPGEKIAKPNHSIGPAFDVGSTRCNWYERPEDHFRLVGHADEGNNAAVDHRGWYVDPDDQGEVARGIVYRLNHGRGFVYGVADPWNDGPAVIARDVIKTDGDEPYAELQANRAADHVAERYAEDEREYREASRARTRHDDLGEDVKSWRKQALALFAEIRELRKTLCGHPNVIAALRDKVESLVEKISDARRERDKLASGYGRDAGWLDA